MRRGGSKICIIVFFIIFQKFNYVWSHNSKRHSNASSFRTCGKSCILKGSAVCLNVDYCNVTSKRRTNVVGVAENDASVPKKATAPPASSRSLRLTLLILIALQNSAMVLVGRHTRNRPKDELFEISSFVIACEVCKLVLSLIFEHVNSGGHLLQSIQENMFNSKESFFILVPSMLYLIQNSLLHVGLTNLSAPVFQVTNQLKLVTTALASTLLLNRRYSAKQWACLGSLGIGVATVILGEQATASKEAASTARMLTDNPRIQSMLLGLVAVCTACVSSALASVSLEFIFKGAPSMNKQPGRNTTFKTTSVTKTNPKRSASLWVRNIELAFSSLCIAIVRRQYFMFVRKNQYAKPFWHGFTAWVYTWLALQACGGLVVAAVIKYADNVLKGLATGVSVVLSSALSSMIFGTPINRYFSIGATTILISVYLFSNDLPLVKRSR